MTYRSSREVDAADAVPATQAHGSIQWKGTDVCMDIRCPCGQAGHLDTEFAYYYQCAACGRKYEVGCNVRLYELADDYVAYPDGPKHEPSFKVDLEMSSREGREIPVHPNVSTATREQRRTEVDLQIAAAQVRAHYAAGGGPLKITFDEPDPKTRTMSYSVTLPETRTYKIDLTVEGDTVTPGRPVTASPFEVSGIKPSQPGFSEITYVPLLPDQLEGSALAKYAELTGTRPSVTIPAKVTTAELVASAYKFKIPDAPAKPDRLGDFLTMYDEYLDGTRAYEDLPASVLSAAVDRRESDLDGVFHYVGDRCQDVCPRCGAQGHFYTYYDGHDVACASCPDEAGQWHPAGTYLHDGFLVTGCRK